MFRAKAVVSTIGLAALVSACGGGGGSDGGSGGGSGGAGGGSGGSGGGSAVVTPLAASAFVYEKRVRTGVSHLYVYDAATGQQRLLTNLDDTGSAGVKSSGHAISPDRKSVAFTAFFRPSADDLATGLATESLWTVAADGSAYRRVTATTPDPNTSSCTSDLQCTAPDTTCNLTVHRCRLKNFVIHLSNPAWSVDGQTLFLEHGQFWTSGSSLTGGSSLARVAASGGAPALGQAQSCQVQTSPAARPGGQKLAAVTGVCTGAGKEGLYEWNADLTAPVLLVESDWSLSTATSVEVSFTPPQWLADSSGLAFVARGNFQDQSLTTFQGSALYLYSPANQSVALLHPPLANGTNVASFSISADQHYLALCMRTSTGTDLYLMDLSQNPIQPAQKITTDGASCTPRF